MFLLVFGSASLFFQGFCSKFPKFWVRWRISAELASKFAWVRPKNRSELGTQNRKKTLRICKYIADYSAAQLKTLLSISPLKNPVTAVPWWCWNPIQCHVTFTCAACVKAPNSPLELNGCDSDSLKRLSVGIGGGIKRFCENGCPLAVVSLYGVYCLHLSSGLRPFLMAPDMHDSLFRLADGASYCTILARE